MGWDAISVGILITLRASDKTRLGMDQGRVAAGAVTGTLG